MNDTPRTDKAIALMCHVCGVPVDIARQLERDLNKALKALRGVRNELHRMNRTGNTDACYDIIEPVLMKLETQEHKT